MYTNHACIISTCLALWKPTLKASTHLSPYVCLALWKPCLRFPTLRIGVCVISHFVLVWPCQDIGYNIFCLLVCELAGSVLGSWVPRARWAVVWCGVAVGMELWTQAGHVGLLLWTYHAHQGLVSLNIIQLTCPWLVEESCTQIKTILVTSVKSDEKYVCLLVISMLSIPITTNNCTCHDSAAVIACAEFCSDHCSAIRIRANSVDVWFYEWKPLVWCTLDTEWSIHNDIFSKVSYR